MEPSVKVSVDTVSAVVFSVDSVPVIDIGICVYSVFPVAEPADVLQWSDVEVIVDSVSAVMELAEVLSE